MEDQVVSDRFNKHEANLMPVLFLDQRWLHVVKEQKVWVFQPLLFDPCSCGKESFFNLLVEWGFVREQLNEFWLFPKRLNDVKDGEAIASFHDLLINHETVDEVNQVCESLEFLQGQASQRK